ncbi:MAG TPA: NAD(P)H-binding protein [Lacisediminihabitans sp.]|uniref:SDR family oxidoreductase n=1 Tax=Lacisediminihabitans sp. TaxID=2787631 RepID=UPI002ED9F55C
MSPLDLRPTLVMGARGHIGKHVLDGLSARGLPVRASVRTLAPGRFPAGVAVFAADLTDPTSLTLAFDGVAQVFLYANHEGVAGVIAAARETGVERIVLLSSGSVIHPTSAGNAITEEHREVEDAFAAASDLVVVPIRPLVLATNALGWVYSIRATGSLPLYRPDAVTAPIHERDIAAVAVAALTGSPSPRLSELLTGPTGISQREQVAAIAAAAGRDITVAELTRDDALAQFSRFMPAAEAEAVLEFLDDADAGNSPTTSTVGDILGRPATDIGAWAVDHASDFC